MVELVVGGGGCQNMQEIKKLLYVRSTDYEVLYNGVFTDCCLILVSTYVVYAKTAVHNW